MAGMRLILAAIFAVAACIAPVANAWAEDAAAFDPRPRGGGSELPPYLECVPYARSYSGIQIYGDAWTWWDKADGIYQRGNRPQVGAVLAFVPHGNMRLGHVAAVSRVIDNRSVLISHSNWSPINGQRGQVERDVRAIDVSPANDWSQVRVWYAPLGDLGTTAWPTRGFIYPKAGKAPTAVVATPVAASVAVPPRMQVAVAPAPKAAAPVPAVRLQSSDRFTAAFANLGVPAQAPARAPTQVAAADEGDVIGEIIRQRR